MDEIYFKVIDIIPETKDTSTFVLEEINGKFISYQAGQFLTLLIKFNNHEVRRSYSLCSTPGIDKHLAITIKKVENGEISRYLLAKIRKGSVIKSLPPAGRFTIDTNPENQRTILFIAAGNGITPIFSLLKKVLNDEPRSMVVLIYQNRDEKNIIFRKQLQELRKRFETTFKQLDLLSHPKSGSIPSRRLNNMLLEEIVVAHPEMKKPGSLFYLCGPKPLMRMAEFTLKLLGFTDDQIRKENFTVDFVPAPTFTIDPSPKTVIIHKGNHAYTISVTYPKTILQAALDEGIELPYSCKGGRCSTCVAKCLSGSVKMSINEVLTEKDLEQGLILTCVGYAETDCELLYPLSP